MQAFLLIALIIAVAQAAVLTPGRAAMLKVRGGADLGPLSSDLAMQLSKTCATMYVAGAGCKFVNKQVGQDDTALVGAVTEDLWQLNALAAAIATAMFSLGETGFDGVKMTAAIFLGALALKLNDSGANVDTVMANKAQTLIALATAYMGFA